MFLTSQNPAQEEEEEKEVDKEGKEVEQQSMPAITISPEAPLIPAVKKKYPVALPCIREISEQLRRMFRSFDKPTDFRSTNYWSTQ